jgi:hypothetical protein
VLGVASTTAVAADHVTNWGQSGAWAVRIDGAAGNGCFIERQFDSGILLRFGLLPERSGGFVSALSVDWMQITPGETGLVKFFTSEEKFAGEVEMIEDAGMRGGFAFFNNPALPVEIAKRRSLRVVGPEGGEFEVDLTGSARAIAEMERCQAAQE